jgi:hypothetical protein
MGQHLERVQAAGVVASRRCRCVRASPRASAVSVRVSDGGPAQLLARQ